MGTKKDYRPYYEIGCLIVLAGLAVHAFTQEKPNNLEQTTIQETTKDSVPQVNNYPFDSLIGPVWKDPISNVYPYEQ